MAVKARHSTQAALYKESSLPIKIAVFSWKRKLNVGYPTRGKKRKASIKGIKKDKHRKQWKVETRRLLLNRWNFQSNLRATDCSG